MNENKHPLNSFFRALCALIVLFPSVLQAAPRKQPQQTPVYDRPPAVAGQFYSKNKDKMAETVDGLFLKAQRHTVDGQLRALLVPHAGYDYSGLVAAEAYKSMTPGWKTFVIIAPSHH